MIKSPMVEVMEKQPLELLEEVEDLKNDKKHQSELIAALKCQIAGKDKDINRLQHVMDRGRSFSVSSYDCCRLKDYKIQSLQEELETAVIKQHEAMGRALELAGRNQQLERELKDIDNVALAVEEECQKKVKQSLRNMEVMQAKLKEKMSEIKKLEETLVDMKVKTESNKLELENLRAEKKLLEKNLNLATTEKKTLNDKINHFVLVEKNLRTEVTRLQEINKSLLRQMGEMEERVIEVLGTNKERLGEKQKKKKVKNQQSLSSTGSMNSNVNSSLNDVPECCPESHRHNICCHLKEKNAELKMQVQDREREIRELKQEVVTLGRENCCLFQKFECSDHLSCCSGDSIKIILDKLEKERNMALSDISRLQGERDALREKIKLVTESQIGEQMRLEKIMKENEERIRRLETERRELMNSQTSRRLTLAKTEEKCDEFQEQARKAQIDLAQMTTNYNQLKMLQEQTDRSLSDVQGRLNEVAMDLRFATNRIKELEKEKTNLENDLCVLRREKADVKSSLTFMEKEKDGLLIILDEKTERVAKLENQVKKQEAYISELTEKISHLEKKFEYTLKEKTSREHGLRSLERAVEHLKGELQECEFQKEAFIQENRRLQDDLASAAKDCLTARRDLDNEKQEVENLKRQLQQYVSEVKRAEELLSKKEIERNQMLDHFRCLSLEATALESNNHTLESTVENTRTQLESASNRVTDLEHQIASKDSLLYNYEKQIAELTTQIAELESKLKQQTEQKTRTEEDLAALRDLCSTIDNQKEAFRRQASTYDTEKTQLINEVRRLSHEYEGLSQKLSHERSLSQTLEKSLSNSRQETLEHKITNKDLQSHVHHLKQKVDELTEKLDSECQEVRRYQAQCADLCQQVSELRREVTNARFEQAKAAEESRRNINGEELKDFVFEWKMDESSARNIPMLTFPEDSDRTVSLDYEADILKCHFDEPGLTFRKFDWKLPPLPEGKSGSAGEGHSKEATISEFSSLPDDTESGNCPSRTVVSNSDDKLTDLTMYPTYSIHGTLNFQSHSSLIEKSGRATNSSSTYEITGHSGGHFLFLEEEAFEDVEPCSECLLEVSLERTDNVKVGENGVVSEVASSAPSLSVVLEDLPQEICEGDDSLKKEAFI